MAARIMAVVVRKPASLVTPALRMVVLKDSRGVLTIGRPGPRGGDGDPGAAGPSAYQVAVANGFVGDEAAWLASLVANVALHESTYNHTQLHSHSNKGTLDLIDQSLAQAASPTFSGLSIAPNTDAAVYLGRAAFGSPITDRLYLAHYDNLTSTDFALLQLATGSTSLNSKSGQPLYLAIGSVAKVTVAVDGKVGIGTASPASELHVKNSTTHCYIGIDAAAASLPVLQFRVAGVEKATLFVDPALGAGGISLYSVYSASRVQNWVENNIGFNTSTFGTSAAKVLAIASGTAPSTSPADAVQLWVEDQSAGNAGLVIMAEGGQKTYIGKQILLPPWAPGVPQIALASSPSVGLSLAAGEFHYVNGTTVNVRMWNQNVTLCNSGTLYFDTGGSYGNAALTIDAADKLAIRRGTNAQTLNIYNTYTNASNYERGFIRWNANVLEIGAEAAGTGTVRNIAILGNVAITGEVTGARTAINTQTDSYTLVASDAGKTIEMNKTTACTLTIPANASVAFPVGTVINISQIGAGQVTVALTSDTLRSSGGKVKLTGQYSVASLYKRAATEWVLSGDMTT